MGRKLWGHLTEMTGKVHMTLRGLKSWYPLSQCHCSISTVPSPVPLRQGNDSVHMNRKFLSPTDSVAVEVKAT